MPMSRPGCRIYNNNGEIERVQTLPLQAATEAARVPTTAGLVPITEIMTTDVICVRRDLDTERVIGLVLRNYIGCVPVVDAQGLPIGMITKRDIVEQLACVLQASSDADEDPLPRRLAARTAEDLMLPFAFTLDEHATVGRAAALMATEALHHVPVIAASGMVIGMVSSLDVVRWLARNDGLVPEA